jgi:hypothetical protein
MYLRDTRPHNHAHANTAHRVSREHMDVSVINRRGRTLYRARVKRRTKLHELPGLS